MQRRGEGGQPVKDQRARPKARNAPTGQELTDRSTEQFDRLKRERNEAREQQAATAEILRVIRASPNDVQPVFETIVRNAVSLCGGLFANVFRFDGELLHYVASHNVGPSYADILRAKYPMRPNSSQVSGRVVLTKSVVWLEDALADPDYDQRFPVAMGWRRLLGVPMLRQGEPIGVIGVGWAEPGPASKVQEELLKTFADQAVIAIENTRLLNELRESLQQQTAAADVLKVISRSANDVQPVFETIARSAVDLCGATYGIVFRYDGELITMAAHHNLDHAALEALNQIWPMRPDNRTVMGRTILQRNVVHIPDAESEPSLTFAAAHKAALGVRTYLGVPMLRNGNPIGAIALFRREVSLFSERQIELVKAFADQAVIAIENTRLLSELRESLQQQTATADVLKAIAGSGGELALVFETMLENAVRICEASYGNMWLCEGEDFRTAALHGPLPPTFVEKWRSGTLFSPGPEVPSVRAAKTRQPVQVADLRADQAYLDGDPLAVSGVEEAGMRTTVAVPMLKENRTVGVIVIYRKEVRAFSDKQIELLSNFAAQAVIAIENARLLSELRESLQQQTATADVLKVISRSTFDLQAVFQTLIELAARLCGADRANISRVRDGTFQHVAIYGFDEGYLEYMQAHPLKFDRGSVNGRTALERSTVHVHDVLTDPDYTLHEAQKLGSFRTALGVPLLREGTPIGTMFLGRSRVEPFTQQEIDLVATFADQAVIAIENVRLFDEVQSRTRELSELLEQQTATSEILQTINKSPGDLTPVFDTMVESAMRLCQADYGHVYSYDGKLLHLVAAHGEPRYVNWIKENGPRTPGGSLTFTRILGGEPLVHLADISQDVSYRTGNQRAKTIVDQFGIHTLLTVPLRKEETLLGGFVLYRVEAKPFSDKQISLVQNFAAQAVIAMENARLLDELRESLQQQTATADVLKVISRSAFDLRTVLQTLVESAARLCDAEKATITRQKGGVFYRTETYGFSPEFMDYVKNIPVEPERGDSCRTRIVGRQGSSHSRCASRSRIYLRRTATRRLSHNTWHSHVARRRSDRRFDTHPFRSQAIHCQAN